MAKIKEYEVKKIKASFKFKKFANETQNMNDFSNVLHMVKNLFLKELHI